MKTTYNILWKPNYVNAWLSLFTDLVDKNATIDRAKGYSEKHKDSSYRVQEFPSGEIVAEFLAAENNGD